MPSSRWDAVIFDYGRVLSLAPSEAELQEFAALVGVSEPPFFEIYSATRLDYDAGRADFRQHWRAFADTAGVELRPDQVERIVGMETLMWLRPNPEALALAREIKAEGLRIAILSNMPHDLLADVRKYSWLDEFEVKIWSCELGIVKPDLSNLPRMSQRSRLPRRANSVLRRPCQQRRSRTRLRNGGAHLRIGGTGKGDCASGNERQ